MNQGQTVRGFAVFLACLAIMLNGCALLADNPALGLYHKTLTMQIAENCAGREGYYIPGDPAHICIATHNFNDWRVIWADEADHLFRDMTGLPQPESHRIKRATKE